MNYSQVVRRGLEWRLKSVLMKTVSVPIMLFITGQSMYVDTLKKYWNNYILTQNENAPLIIQ